jgi:[acyl-carrier-protein] S-malonyltransferase
LSYALLFPGQGTQHPQMLGWLEAQAAAMPLLNDVAARLGTDWRARLNDPVFSRNNATAQLLLTGLSLAAWQCLAPHLPPPGVVAGYSVGELPAFCAAGVFDASAALALAAQRAWAMSQAVAGFDTGLLSVSGINAAQTEQLCARHALAVAIELATDRCVLGGAAAALAAAEIDLNAAGLRCQRLAVALASHTAWMRSAVAAFTPALAALPFAAPQATLVCNLTGTAVSGAAPLRHALAEQLAHTVRWQRVMETVAERQPQCVLEVGPGSTLSKLWNEMHPGIPARSVDEFRSPQAAAHWVLRAVA